jgi:hypothetical protein
VTFVISGSPACVELTIPVPADRTPIL